LLGPRLSVFYLAKIEPQPLLNRLSLSRQWMCALPPKAFELSSFMHSPYHPPQNGEPLLVGRCYGERF